MVNTRLCCLMFVFLLTLPTQLWAFEGCELPGVAFTDEVEKLTEVVEAITGEIPPTVLDIAVDYDGSGTVKILTDEKGNLIGLRLDYKGKSKPMQQTKSVEEFNKGQSVAFTKEGQKDNPLVLKTKTGTVLSKETGGLFMFSLLSDLDPAKYINYELSLVRSGKSWKVLKGNKPVSMTIISPEIKIGWTGGSWAGTFKNATFK